MKPIIKQYKSSASSFSDKEIYCVEYDNISYTIGDIISGGYIKGKKIKEFKTSKDKQRVQVIVEDVPIGYNSILIQNIIKSSHFKIKEQKVKAKVTITPKNKTKLKFEVGQLVKHTNGSIGLMLNEPIAKQVKVAVLSALDKLTNQSQFYTQWNLDQCEIWEGKITISNVVSKKEEGEELL